MSIRSATRVVLPIGAVEARRLLRHPWYGAATIFILAVGTAWIVQAPSPRGNLAYLVLLLGLLLVHAPLTLVTANRITAGIRRAEVREALDGTPVDDRHRTAGLLAGVVCGPVTLGSAGAALLLGLGEFTTAANPVVSDRVYQRTVWEYLQIPAVVLGAGLLGVAVARWLPWPGALPLTVLVVWLGTVAMYPSAQAGVVRGRSWFAPWPVWLASSEGMLPRQPLGQEMWHLVYLLGLGVLAGIAALLHTGGPRRGLGVAATVAAVATAVAGCLQLG